MSDYKLPICWLNKPSKVFEPDGTERDVIITEADVNLECQCLNALQAFFCMQGHMTECHVGMSCEEAECSHYERYDHAFFDDGSLDEDDV